MKGNSMKRPQDWPYRPQSLEGKGVIITGGTTGIGRATARLLVAEGARVLIFGRHQRELHDALAEIGADGHVHGLTADQTREEDIERVFQEADRHFEHLDVLINNAGVASHGVQTGVYRGWEYVVKDNLLGYMKCAREALDRMAVRKQGHIVNVGSMSADEREAGSDVYVATKAAIQAWSESLRKSVNEQGIKVSLIEPGKVGTNLGSVPPETQERQEEAYEMLKAEDVAEIIAYCLVQPPRCDIVSLQVRPHLQLI
jgi:NADP-dependent 3-hydroxy acid dehydrogenase YdfG